MRKLRLLLATLGICLIATNAFAVVGIDSYTTLMLHFNGEDASETFTDSSFGGHTLIANGDAQIDTAKSKFGGASGFFDGTGDYLSIPDSTDWSFGTGDFTIDFQVSFPEPVSDFMSIYTQRDDTANYITLYKHVNNYWLLQFKGSGGNSLTVSSGPCPFAIDTWYHVALVRTGDDWKWFQDGVYLGGLEADNTFPDLISDSAIGGNFNGFYWFKGNLDELRVSTGIARWTSDFTPPTSEYEVVPEPTTLSLLGFGLLGLAFRRNRVRS